MKYYTIRAILLTFFIILVFLQTYSVLATETNETTKGYDMRIITGDFKEGIHTESHTLPITLIILGITMVIILIAYITYYSNRN